MLKHKAILAVIFLMSLPNPLNAGIWDDIKSKSSELADSAADMFKSDDDIAASKTEKVQDLSSEYIQIKEKERKAPEESPFKKTKEDYHKSADEVLEEVESTLFDGEIIGYAKEIRKRKDNIQ